MQIDWSRWLLLGRPFGRCWVVVCESCFYISSAKAAWSELRQAVNYALGDWYCSLLLPCGPSAWRGAFFGEAARDAQCPHKKNKKNFFPIASVLFSLALHVLPPWVGHCKCHAGLSQQVFEPLWSKPGLQPAHLLGDRRGGQPRLRVLPAIPANANWRAVELRSAWHNHCRGAQCI